MDKAQWKFIAFPVSEMEISDLHSVFFHMMNYWTVTKLGISMISTISKSELRLAKMFSNESTNKNPMWARIFTCFMWSDQANDNQIYPLLGWNS